MPHDVRFTDTGCDARFTGVVDYQDVRAALLAAATHEYPAGRRYGLFDYSAIDDAVLTGGDLRALGTAGVLYGSADPAGLAVVVVVPRDFTFGLARMWEAYSDGAPTPIRSCVARTRAEAVGWLASLGLGRADFAPDVP